MDATTVETIYYTKPGRDNTDQTLRLAKKRAQELGIDTIILASTRGDTAARASEVFQGFRLIIVTHSTGLKEPDTQELEQRHRETVESRGGIILTVTHAFGGVGRAVRRKLNTYQVEEIIAYTLRILGEGMKVVCEITLMAADAGLVRTDEDIISIAGTGAGNAGRGADVALVLRPACAHFFFETKVREVLCKPHF